MSTTQAALFELPQVRVPVLEQFGRAGVRQIEAASILTATKGKGSLAWFDYSLNPYRGCGFGCSYCYASFFEPKESKRRDWGAWVEVKANAVRLLQRQRDLGGKRIYMSSATDPYQPLEAATGLSRAILEHLADRPDQPEMVIQTRGPLVTRDIDVLQRFRKIRVNMTVPTDSDAVRKRFEPSCASIERRLDALRELRDAGIEIGVSICPMLPVDDPIGFARTLRELGADHYWAGYFHSSERMFAGNTGVSAIELAREYGWTYARYQRTRLVLERLVPGFREYRSVASKAA